jgi:hypothetical protein
MDALNWFKLDVLYKVTSGIFEEEELSEVDLIRLKAEGLMDGDSYEKDTCIISLGEDTIIRVEPRAFIPKGGKNKKFYSEVIFKSGDVVFAESKPTEVYNKLNEYYIALEKTNQSLTTE